MSDKATLSLVVGMVGAAFVLAALMYAAQMNDSRKDRYPHRVHYHENMRRPYTLYNPAVDVVSVHTPPTVVYAAPRWDRRTILLRRSLGREPDHTAEEMTPSSASMVPSLGRNDYEDTKVLGRPTSKAPRVLDLPEIILHPVMHERAAMQPILNGRGSKRRELTSTLPIHSHIGNPVKVSHGKDLSLVHKR